MIVWNNKTLNDVEHWHLSFVNVVIILIKCCKYIYLLYYSLYETDNMPEIKSKRDRRKIETNLQSQSHVFECMVKHVKDLTRVQVS